MPTNKTIDEPALLSQIISNLSPLDDEARQRVLQTVATYFQLGLSGSPQFAPAIRLQNQPIGSPTPGFSNAQVVSPKQFMVEKQPKTDIHRVACLAYYLTHYRDTPYFRTLDISKLNTDAAQPKFGNAAQAVDNALKGGFLAAATKGNKQLSAAGEQFVQALPDYEAASSALSRFKPRSLKKRINRPHSKK